MPAAGCFRQEIYKYGQLLYGRADVIKIMRESKERKDYGKRTGKDI